VGQAIPLLTPGSSAMSLNDTIFLSFAKTKPSPYYKIIL